MFLGELAKIWPGQTDRARLPSLRRRLPGQVRKPPQTSRRRAPQRVRRIGCTGWGPERIARAWVALMQRLGYAQFVAQGGDVGAGVCTAMAKQTPPDPREVGVDAEQLRRERVRNIGRHDPPPSALSADEQRAFDQLKLLFTKRRAYANMMATRPQTLYGLADSPVSLASWMGAPGLEPGTR